MDNNKRLFLLKSSTDQAQNPQTMGPWGRNCGCLGGPEGRISAPRTCRVKCSPKGPKLGFEYLATYKTLHCVHGIPQNALRTPPCGDTWVCQVVIALWKITQATACTAKKRSRLITNRNVRS